MGLEGASALLTDIGRAKYTTRVKVTFTRDEAANSDLTKPPKSQPNTKISQKIDLKFFDVTFEVASREGVDRGGAN